MTSADAPIGVIAHYNLLERLEHHGSGELYRARDTRVGRTVAIRVMPGNGGDATARLELIETAGRLSAFSHPNVITLFDAGEHEGRIYVAFEFLKGQSLRAELAGRPMNVRRAVDLAAQITGAIADAHAQGFPCAGLSPDSVIVTAKGLAKIPTTEMVARDGFETVAGRVRLKDYESPEEARGDGADERSDIYSAGAVLFEMLTGRRPSHRGAAAPSASNSAVPKALDEVVLKAIAPNAERRYQNAATLAAALRNLATPESLPGRMGQREIVAEQAIGVGRLLLVAVLLLLVGAGIVWLF